MRKGFGIVIAALLIGPGGCYTVRDNQEATPGRAATPKEYEIVEHKHWNGDVGPALECVAGRDGAPARIILDPSYERPELMAIGDSLYNGVQSGRINWRLAEWSAPVMVALRLDLIREHDANRTGERDFHVPQYPAVIGGGLDGLDFGFNLDDAPRLPDLLGEGGRISARLRYLMNTYRPPNGRPMVENIAYSGANSIDLMRMTPRRFRAAATDLIGRGKGQEAFTYANAAFVLNPTRDDCLEDMTALDQVVLRKPRRLIVSVGSNNGVWRAGFYGEAVDSAPGDTPCVGDSLLPDRCVPSTRDFLGQTLVRDLRSMMAELARVPETEGVYINGLIKPSRVANLVPVDERPLEGHPGYVRAYDLALFRARQAIPGDQVQETDAFVMEVNHRIVAEIEAANAGLPKPKFHFVDIDAAIAVYDTKACLRRSDGTAGLGCAPGIGPLTLTPSQHGLTCEVALTNRPLALEGQGPRRKTLFCQGIYEGGLFSMDNMHPSSAGYAILAQAVRVRMNETGLFPREILARGYDCPQDRPKPEQQCTALMVHPGYMTTDSNMREVETLAWSGTTERRRLAYIRGLANVLRNFR